VSNSLAPAIIGILGALLVCLTQYLFTRRSIRFKRRSSERRSSIFRLRPQLRGTLVNVSSEECGGTERLTTTSRDSLMISTCHTVARLFPEKSTTCMCR